MALFDGVPRGGRAGRGGRLARAVGPVAALQQRRRAPVGLPQVLAEQVAGRESLAALVATLHT